MIDENDIYSKNLSVLKFIKGEPISFGKSCVDENYLSIISLYIQNKSEKNDKTKKNSEKIKRKDNLCIICHCNLRESVFFPCGHRVTCYLCTVYYFAIYKNCPKCVQEAKSKSETKTEENSEVKDYAYIQKVYEQFNEIQENEKENQQQ